MRKLAWKRSESVLVLVAAGEQVLLLRRCQPVGFWQSVTGSLRWGESAASAARRELYEETGIMAGGQLIDLRQWREFPIVDPWCARYAPQVRVNREHWFLLRLPQRRLIRLSPSEHDRVRWLPAVAARKKVASWTNREAIERYCGAGVR